MPADHTRLKGSDSIGEFLLSDQLETNVAAFLQNGLLEQGAFFNVRVPTTGVYGGDLHRLRPLADPNYASGQVWQGFRKDWVWETGLGWWGVQPIRVSGVNVGGVFRPATGVGPYAHRVDYPAGRVIFESGLPLSSEVTCEYSYRFVHVTTADAPWWREFQFSSMRGDDPHFAQHGSGTWATLPQSRVQLPAVVVEASPTVRRRPFQLGDTSATVTQDVLCHVFAETPSDRKRLHDRLTGQWQKRLVGFDVNNLLFPLEDGTPVSSGKMYPDWVKETGAGGYAWRRITIADTQSYDQRDVSPLFFCTVRLQCEIDTP